MPDEIIRREFPAELVPSGDGRTLDLRVVPFNTVARVSDDGGRTVYEEMWMPGAFDRQLSAANRVDVLVNFEHRQDIGNVVARGTELRDTGDALDMTARMLSGPSADTALELVNERVLAGVSLEAIVKESERGSDGIVRRKKARLVNVALCRSPAFEDAQVMAVREAPEPDVPEPSEPTPDDEDAVLRVDIPAGMDAMPDGVKACKMNGTAGYSGGKACHMHDGSESGMKLAMAKAMADMRSSRSSISGEAIHISDSNPLPVRQFTHEEVEAVAASVERKSRVDELLERVGYEPIVHRAITSKAWDGSASRFSDSEYERSCLICRGGDEPPKTRCSLPVLEPDGTLNTKALGAAAARLNQLTGVTTAQKAAAARKLRRLYAQAEMEPPPSVMAMAGRA